MIEIRDVQPEDRDKIRQWRNLPEVAKYMYTDHHITPMEHEEWFQRTLDDPTCRYWIIVCDGTDVGLVNIYRLDCRNTENWNKVLLSFDIDPSMRLIDCGDMELSLYQGQSNSVVCKIETSDIPDESISKRLVKALA